MCAGTACGAASTAVPAGVAYTVTLKNNSTVNDSIANATGSGYTIGAGAPDPPTASGRR